MKHTLLLLSSAALGLCACVTSQAQAQTPTEAVSKVKATGALTADFNTGAKVIKISSGGTLQYDAGASLAGDLAELRGDLGLGSLATQNGIEIDATEITGGAEDSILIHGAGDVVSEIGASTGGNGAGDAGKVVLYFSDGSVSATDAVNVSHSPSGGTTYGHDSLGHTDSTGGQMTITYQSLGGNTRSLVIPARNGAFVTTGDSGTVTNTMLAGSITLSKLTGLGTGVATLLGTFNMSNANAALSDGDFVFTGAANVLTDVMTVKAVKLNTSDGAYLRDGYEATGDINQKGRLVWGNDAYGVSTQLNGYIISLSRIVSGTGFGSPYFAGVLVAPADHQWHVHSGANATSTSFFNTYTDGTHFESFGIDWRDTANLARVGTLKGSAEGTARDWALVHGGAEKARVTSGGMTMSDDLSINTGDGTPLVVQNGGGDRFKISTTATSGSFWVGYADGHAYEAGGNTWIYSYDEGERCRFVFGENAYNLYVKTANTSGPYGLVVSNGDNSAAYISSYILLNDTVGVFTVEPNSRDYAGGYTGAGHTMLVKGGNGQSFSTGAAGGDYQLKGGNAGGSGNNDGGDIRLEGGAKTGSGAKGGIYLDLDSLPTSDPADSGKLWRDGDVIKISHP